MLLVSISESLGSLGSVQKLKLDRQHEQQPRFADQVRYFTFIVNKHPT